jgi:hypothetical protein
MSRLNGDKSRHQINRKRAVLRRAKIRKLLDDVKNRSTATPGPSSAASSPATAKSH